MGTVTNQAGNGYSVSTEGLLHLANGSTSEIKTQEGMVKAEHALNDSQLAEMIGLMKAQGYNFNGSHFVPYDTYAEQQENKLGGPKSVKDGITEDDKDTQKVFLSVGITSPYNANTTNALFSKMINDSKFATSLALTRAYLTNPTLQNQQAAAAANSALAQQHPGANPMEILYLVFRESIKDVNEDKRYFLKKLMDYNKMGEQLSKYLSTLVDASTRLSAAESGAEEPARVMIGIEVRECDSATLNAAGEMVPTKNESASVNRYGLNDRIKYVETQQEDVRNRRQMATTAFQNFDQKSNQLMNMLSSLLKTMNEMRSIGAASRSGL